MFLFLFVIFDAHPNCFPMIKGIWLRFKESIEDINNEKRLEVTILHSELRDINKALQNIFGPGSLIQVWSVLTEPIMRLEIGYNVMNINDWQWKIIGPE